MAIRSLILSVFLTGFLGYSLTIGLTDPNTFLKKIPEALAIPLLLVVAALYLVATWWAFKGFGEHKLAAVISFGFCAFGLGIYALGISMEMGRGKASSGQYDYDFNSLDPAEKTAITQVAANAGLQLQQAVFSEHWHLSDTTKSFRICVQKGHITGLNLSHQSIGSPALFSKFPQLSDLYLSDCGLSDMGELKNPRIDRLNVTDNKITDLTTLSGCPNVRWLFVTGNPLKSKDTRQFKQLIDVDVF